MSNHSDRDSVASHRYAAEVGDYVLATKYSDGDPCDHFYVGFVSGYTHHGRYLIVDNEGKNQRANGFRRVEKITHEEGAALVALMPQIGDRRGKSLWWHLGKIRGEQDPHDPCETDEERLQRVAKQVLREMEVSWNREFPTREEVHRWGQMLRKALDPSAGV